MSRLQKKAWFTLVVVSLALGLSLAAFGVGFFLFDLPVRRAAGGFGFFGIMGLLDHRQLPSVDGIRRYGRRRTRAGGRHAGAVPLDGEGGKP